MSAWPIARRTTIGQGLIDQPPQTRARASAWAWILRTAAAIWSMSLRVPRNMVWMNQTASWHKLVVGRAVVPLLVAVEDLLGKDPAEALRAQSGRQERLLVQGR